MCLHANDVWRFCLSWGARRCNLAPGRCGTWSDKDRTRLRAELEGVVQHVKVQQMDARVYSEEVEPTGLLPPDLGRFNPSNSDISNGNNINISNTQSSLNRLNIRAETGNGLLRYRKTVFVFRETNFCHNS